MAKPCTPHLITRKGYATSVRQQSCQRLCKSPDQFTTGQILRLMEGSLAPVACLEAGSSPCDRAGECRTLSLWAGLNDVINKYLDQYTLADLLREDGDYDYVI